ncbi:MAG: UDP-4-amino-4,6-dideoxy-N-acetyl-beta-L-altrosamine transaminase [Chlamydiota bacterium]|nr:UDP-4-amino-4,6-dideoxy-N-acetyl-beta-L-altrosamine transaminase [Chlamydiota bacterium]
MTDFFPYAKQSINSDDITAVTDILTNGFITRGPKVTEFEQAIAEYCGAKFAVAFNSGSSALIASGNAAGVSKHDRIITTPNTFVATIAGGWHRGAEPLFIDIDPATGNIDLEELEPNLQFQSLSGRNILMPVHFSGIPVDMEKLDGMIKDPDTVVIEDAAHALGSSYKDGQKVGCCAWSDMTVFSFHPAKNITSGEGGMVLTNDETLFKRLQQFRNNGIDHEKNNSSEDCGPWFYEVAEVTGNYHMTDIQAALGLSQLSRIGDFAKKRRKLMELYRKELKKEKGVSFFEVENDDQVMYHLCVLKIDFEKYETTRVKVMDELKEKGIGTQVHYIPLYRHPFFTKSHRRIEEYFPKTEEYYSQALSFPLYYDLSEKDVKMITKTLKEILKMKSPTKV